MTTDEKADLTIGEKIDKLYAKRAERLALEKTVEAMKAEEAVLREEIIHALHDVGLASARGGAATATIKKSISPIVADWDQVYTYIKENNRFDLLHQRITVQAWKDLLNDGILIPGTESFNKEDLSLTKATR